MAVSQSKVCFGVTIVLWSLLCIMKIRERKWNETEDSVNVYSRYICSPIPVSAAWHVHRYKSRYTEGIPHQVTLINYRSNSYFRFKDLGQKGRKAASGDLLRPIFAGRLTKSDQGPA